MGYFGSDIYIKKKKTLENQTLPVVQLLNYII